MNSGDILCWIRCNTSQRATSLNRVLCTSEGEWHHEVFGDLSIKSYVDLENAQSGGSLGLPIDNVWRWLSPELQSRYWQSNDIIIISFPLCPPFPSKPPPMEAGWSHSKFNVVIQPKHHVRSFVRNRTGRNQISAAWQLFLIPQTFPQCFPLLVCAWHFYHVAHSISVSSLSLNKTAGVWR